MQGKEAPEQKTPKCSAGIDVSKDWLDGHILPAEVSKRVANTKQGLAQLKRWLLRYKVELVAVEATGKWHRLLCRSLVASQIATAVTNPYRVRMFAKACGILAKTDRLDARVLALFARMMAPPCRGLPDEAFEGLQELVNARQSAVGESVMLQNQRSSAGSSYLKRQLACRIKQVDGHIKALEKQCLALIKAGADMARRYEILTSIPGIGAIVAMTLIANLPELGSLNDKQAAALGGLAPVADDSGKRQGVRVVYGGRPVLRKVLYLAALAASRYNRDLKLYRDHLAAKGKAAKLILIAIARKLLVLANLLVEQDRLWLAVPPKHP